MVLIFYLSQRYNESLCSLFGGHIKNVSLRHHYTSHLIKFLHLTHFFSPVIALFLTLGFSHVQMFGRYLLIMNPDSLFEVDVGVRGPSGCACTILSVRYPNEDLTNSILG